MKTFLRFSAIALTVLSTLRAQADWKAHMVTTSGAKARAEKAFEGEVFLKGKKMRMDTKGGAQGAMTMIMDSETKVMHNLLHQQKLHMIMDFSKVPSKEASMIAMCDASQGAVKCLKAQGYHPAGQGTANGFDCDIYEKKENDTIVRIWHPKAHDDLPSVRFVTSDRSGAERMRMDLLDVKQETLPSSTFEAPKDYKVQDMAAFMKGMMDLKGLDPAAIRAKLKR